MDTRVSRAPLPPVPQLEPSLLGAFRRPCMLSYRRDALPYPVPTLSATPEDNAHVNSVVLRLEGTPCGLLDYLREAALGAAQAPAALSSGISTTVPISIRR
jgi:hypothetical protein